MLKNIFFKIHHSLKLLLSFKKIIFVIFLTITMQMYSCKDNNSIAPYSEGDVNVSLKNYETYEYPTVSGDEEGAIIKTQAKHFEISEIKRNAETNYVAVYKYKPKLNYVGNDFVEIETTRGSDGASPSKVIKTVKINFIISK